MKVAVHAIVIRAVLASRAGSTSLRPVFEATFHMVFWPYTGPRGRGVFWPMLGGIATCHRLRWWWHRRSCRNIGIVSSPITSVIKPSGNNAALRSRRVLVKAHGTVIRIIVTCRSLTRWSVIRRIIPRVLRTIHRRLGRRVGSAVHVEAVRRRWSSHSAGWSVLCPGGWTRIFRVADSRGRNGA